jgi:hypothetical protein
MGKQKIHTTGKWIAPRGGGYAAESAPIKRPTPPKTPATITGVRAAAKAATK